MSRAAALIAVFIAAFIVLIGILAVFAGIADAFPTTEESFFKFGPEIKGVVLAVVGVVVVAAGLLLSRAASKFSR